METTIPCSLVLNYATPNIFKNKPDIIIYKVVFGNMQHLSHNILLHVVVVKETTEAVAPKILYVVAVPHVALVVVSVVVVIVVVVAVTN